MWHENARETISECAQQNPSDLRQVHQNKAQWGKYGILSAYKIYPFIINRENTDFKPILVFMSMN